MLLGDVFGIMSSVSFSLVLTRTNRIRQEIPIDQGRRGRVWIMGRPKK